MHIIFFSWVLVSPGQSQSVLVSPSQSRLILVSPGESYWMKILGDSQNSTRNGIIWLGFLWNSSRNFSWIYSHLSNNGWGTIPGGILQEYVGQGKELFPVAWCLMTLKHIGTTPTRCWVLHIPISLPTTKSLPTMTWEWCTQGKQLLMPNHSFSHIMTTQGKQLLTQTIHFLTSWLVHLDF